MRFVAASYAGRRIGASTRVGRRFSGAVCLCLAMLLLAFVIEGRAQQRAADPSDPRIGLKAGLRDAGEAARNMERISSLPKPEGFFDPKAPGGTPIPPERDPNLPPLPPPDPDSPAAVAQANMLGFANSDLAFSGNHVFMGNFHGFTTYDVERPSKPKLSASVVCPGGQGDMSVHGHLLFMSVEQTRGRLDCGTQGVPSAGQRGAFSRRPDLRHHRSEQAEADRGGADVPRIAHAHDRARSERPENAVRLRLRHQHGAVGRGARRLLRTRTRRTIRTRRSSAST